MKHAFFAVIALGLSGCLTSGSELGQSNVQAALADKTLIGDVSTINFNSNGRLTGVTPNGTNFRGTWRINENGEYCQNLTSPPSFRRSTCQEVLIGGNQAAFVRPNGTKSTYMIQ